MDADRIAGADGVHADGFFCSGLFVLIHADVAQAYLDPGTGSFLVQMLIAGLVGGAFAVKMFWYKITGGIARLFGHKKEDGDGGQQCTCRFVS